MKTRGNELEKIAAGYIRVGISTSESRTEGFCASVIEFLYGKLRQNRDEPSSEINFLI